MRKLSISTSSINPMRIEAAFIAAKRFGYGGVELMVSPVKESQNEDFIKDMIQKHQVPVTSIHAPTLLLCKFVWGTEPGEKLRRSAEFAEQVGADAVVVHPPVKKSPYAARFLDTVKQVEAAYDVDVAVENMFPWRARGMSYEMYGPSWSETCDTTKHLTFDFSHAALSGMDVMEFFRNYHEKVRIIHFTDGSTRNEQKGDKIADEHLLPGHGDMPLQEVYDFLNANNWQGETVLEINTRKQSTLAEKAPALQHCVDFFNNLNQ